MPNQSQPTNRSGAAHTPGPWAFAAYQYGKRPRWETIWGHSKHIATITQGYSAERDDCPDDKEAQANARLIASAPALLEACKAALHLLHEYDRKGSLDMAETEAMKEYLEDEIAQAQGEVQR